MAPGGITPKKSVQDVCRVCGRGFHENKKNKLNLFGSGNLSAFLEAIIGENVGFYDGLPPFVCTTCGSMQIQAMRSTTRQNVSSYHQRNLLTHLSEAT
jgi:hypothetical protein